MATPRNVTATQEEVREIEVKVLETYPHRQSQTHAVSNQKGANQAVESKRKLDETNSPEAIPEKISKTISPNQFNIQDLNDLITYSEVMKEGKIYEINIDIKKSADLANIIPHLAELVNRLNLTTSGLLFHLNNSTDKQTIVVNYHRNTPTMHRNKRTIETQVPVIKDIINKFILEKNGIVPSKNVKNSGKNSVPSDSQVQGNIQKPAATPGFFNQKKDDDADIFRMPQRPQKRS